jgi:hypothetical protein
LLNLVADLNASNVDLLHDMGSSEAFIVDGESLVYEAVASASSNSRVTCPAAAIYRVELLLDQLRAIGGSFTIVFCEEYRQAWAAYSAQAYAIRQSLIAHLHAACPGMVQHCRCNIAVHWPASNSRTIP